MVSAHSADGATCTAETEASALSSQIDKEGCPVPPLEAEEAEARLARAGAILGRAAVRLARQARLESSAGSGDSI